jgi:galactonate dehydratase
MQRITGVSLIPVTVSEKTAWQHVVLQTSEGLRGVGEYTVPAQVQGMDDKVMRVAKELIGQAASRDTLEQHADLLTQGFASATAYSALEQALCDLVAQVRGVSIASLLSNRPPMDSVDLYANINRRTLDRTPAGFADSALKAIDNGFTTLKIAPFDDLTPALCESTDGAFLIRKGLERILAVGNVLAERTPQQRRVQVDCHWRFSFETVRNILDQLVEAGVNWLECPLPEIKENLNALAGLRTLCSERGIRLAGLETAATLQGFKPFIDAGAYDVIMPDIKHAGGFKSILEIAQFANRHSVAISLHNPSGPVAHAATVQLASILPVKEQHEIQFAESSLFWTITDPEPASIKNGNCTVSTLPGLGLGLSSTLGNDTKSHMPG